MVGATVGGAGPGPSSAVEPHATRKPSVTTRLVRMAPPYASPSPPRIRPANRSDSRRRWRPGLDRGRHRPGAATLALALVLALALAKPRLRSRAPTSTSLPRNAR